MCGFFHISSTSVAPGLKMGPQICFCTSVFWPFFFRLCLLLSIPSSALETITGSCFLFCFVFQRCRWSPLTFKCFPFDLTLGLLWVSSEWKIAGRISSCCSTRGGCRVQLFRSLKPVLLIHFNQLLLQCITHSCGSHLASPIYPAVHLNGNLVIFPLVQYFVLFRIFILCTTDILLIYLATYQSLFQLFLLLILYSCNLHFGFFLRFSMHCFSLYCGIWQNRRHCKQDFTVLYRMLNLLFTFTLPSFLIVWTEQK